MPVSAAARTGLSVAAVAGLVLSVFGQVPANAEQADASAPSAPTAPASATATTPCKVRAADVTFRPGVTLKPGRGSFVGSAGRVDCDGRVLGRTVTGPGVYTSAGRIGTVDPDSCTSGGEGWGVMTITFPTAKGKFVLRNPFTFTYGAVTKKGLLKGEFTGDFFDGVFSITPKKGNCVTSPLTVSTASAEGEVHPYRAPR
ncbi:MAG: hypothetical protein ACT4QF_08245 [Sporichthyaceae bacterium]